MQIQLENSVRTVKPTAFGKLVQRTGMGLHGVCQPWGSHGAVQRGVNWVVCLQGLGFIFEHRHMQICFFPPQDQCLTHFNHHCLQGAAALAITWLFALSKPHQVRAARSFPTLFTQNPFSARYVGWGFQPPAILRQPHFHNPVCLQKSRGLWSADLPSEQCLQNKSVFGVNTLCSTKGFFNVGASFYFF